MNAEVSTFDDSLMQTAKEMLMVMYAADGIGLAAPQVGINKRLMVFNEAGEPEKKEQEMVLVNPVITAKSEETNLREEGCLSFPQINGDVQRYEWVEVEYQTTSGEKTKT
jgi:peptide deformylase